MNYNYFEKREYPYPEPEWTAENINRKKGDTTFKQCGWCEHVSSGTCRYNCYLHTSCSLLKKYGVGCETYWDTPCIVVLLGKKDFASIIKSKQWEIESLQNSTKRLTKEIFTIAEISAPDKPPLPESRVDDFDEGETVWVFYEGKWNKGTVVPGYRSHDGCVSYVLDDYPDSAKGWGCGVAVPSILKDWEHKYFKEHLDDFRIWLNLSDREYNGEKLDLEKYYEALEINEKSIQDF